MRGAAPHRALTFFGPSASCHELPRPLTLPHTLGLAFFGRFSGGGEAADARERISARAFSTPEPAGASGAPEEEAPGAAARHMAARDLALSPFGPRHTTYLRPVAVVRSSTLQPGGAPAPLSASVGVGAGAASSAAPWLPLVITPPADLRFLPAALPRRQSVPSSCQLNLG